MRNGHLSIAMALVSIAALSSAQWLNHPDPTTPRGKDGKPNLSARAPRVKGKPDLSGVWEVESTPRAFLSKMFPPGVGLLPNAENGLGEDDPNKYFLNVLVDFKPGEEPLTPAAAAELRKRLQSTDKPESLCEIPGIPFAEMVPAPFKIMQTPRATLVLYEGFGSFRQIFTDGRKLPVDPQPAFLGYSVGRWEGDWFVVETAGFNDRTGLDAMGHGHSEALRVTQRYHRRDFGHMDVQLTLDDPKTFTKPVMYQVTYRLLPDTDLIEMFCTEAEKDLAHLPGK